MKDPKSVNLNFSDEIISSGKTVQFKAVVNPSDAVPQVYWRSDNPNVARIDQNGKVTAVKQGTTWIYATTVNGLQAKAFIKVLPKPTDVILNYNKKIVTVGRTTQFKASVYPVKANQAVTWRTGNPKVAVIDKNGKIIAKAKGSTYAYAKTINGKETKCLLIVK